MADAEGSRLNDNAKLLELRANYWLKRLDHTLTHTQSSSRLIYLVDGAVLALLYFAIQTFGPSRQVVFLAAFPTFLLAALNLFHARLIAIQHSWYRHRRAAQTVAGTTRDPASTRTAAAGEHTRSLSKHPCRHSVVSGRSGGGNGPLWPRVVFRHRGAEEGGRLYGGSADRLRRPLTASVRQKRS